MNLFGLHHISAITASRSECVHFYGRLLGFSSFAESGSGTLSFAPDPERSGGVLSFVVVPGAPGGVPGRGFVHRLQWSVTGAAGLRFWRRRLELAGVGVTAWLNGAGDPLALRFSDPDGLDHELTIDLSPAAAPPGGVSAIPPQMRIS